MNPSQSPSIWFNDTTHYPNVMRQLEVDGLSVKYIGLGNSDVDAASVRYMFLMFTFHFVITTSPERII